MADNTPNTANSNANSNSSSNNINTGGSSSNSSNLSPIIDIIGIVDGTEEECCANESHGHGEPEQFCLSKGDVIVIRVDNGEMSASTFNAVATQTAAKFKNVFPSNNILVIPTSTNFSIIKQPEVHV
jgi:hypothetical protein